MCIICNKVFGRSDYLSKYFRIYEGKGKNVVQEKNSKEDDVNDIKLFNMEDDDDEDDDVFEED